VLPFFKLVESTILKPFLAALPPRVERAVVLEEERIQSTNHYMNDTI